MSGRGASSRVLKDTKVEESRIERGGGVFCFFRFLNEARVESSGRGRVEFVSLF